MTTPSAPDGARAGVGDPSQAGAATAATAAAAEPPRGRSGPVALLWAFVRETLIVLALSVVLFLIAKTWLIASFWIPSDSMNNTLIRNDRVMVSRLTPGPFSLSRGDIVVFEDPSHWLRGGVPRPAEQEAASLGARLNRALVWVGLLPDDLGNHLVKRVVGLPGDRVACCSSAGRLIVNGADVNESYVREGDPPSQIPFDITVPADKIWVMGDHRSDSADSRFNDTADVATGQSTPATAADPKNNTGYYGSVPVDRVVGKAFAVVWPSSRLSWLGTVPDAFDGVPAPPPALPSASPSASASASPSASAPNPLGSTRP
ncbi:MAG: signal peptidase I [Austwickia sp.]|nr:signal peptidase I [Austwickia sp.]